VRAAGSEYGTKADSYASGETEVGSGSAKWGFEVAADTLTARHADRTRWVAEHPGG